MEEVRSRAQVEQVTNWIFKTSGTSSTKRPDTMKTTCEFVATAQARRIRRKEHGNQESWLATFCEGTL